jgi:hypothetical protein
MILGLGLNWGLMRRDSSESESDHLGLDLFRFGLGLLFFMFRYIELTLYFRQNLLNEISCGEPTITRNLVSAIT